LKKPSDDVPRSSVRDHIVGRPPLSAAKDRSAALNVFQG
jgi:hypothetical protein